LARLSVIVPLSILLIFVLLFNAFGSFKEAALIVLNIPFALPHSTDRFVRLRTVLMTTLLEMFGLMPMRGRAASAPRCSGRWPSPSSADCFRRRADADRPARPQRRLPRATRTPRRRRILNH